MSIWGDATRLIWGPAGSHLDVFTLATCSDKNASGAAETQTQEKKGIGVRHGSSFSGTLAVRTVGKALNEHVQI